MSEDSLPRALHSDLLLSHLVRTMRLAWLREIVAGRTVLEIAPADEVLPALPAEMGRRVGFSGVATAWMTGDQQPWSNVAEIVDPAALPDGDRSVDVLVCLDGLARMAQPTAFLDEARRVLGRDGLLVVATQTARGERRPAGHPLGPRYPSTLLLSQVGHRFAHVETAEEHLMLASVITPSTGEGAESVHALVPDALGGPWGIVAVAGNGAMPTLRPAATLDASGIFESWIGEIDRLADEAHQAVAEVARSRTEDQVAGQARVLVAEGGAARPGWSLREVLRRARELRPRR